MLKNKKILLGVTGGIAAYKAIDLASRLRKEGAIVRTILTKSALKFISENNFRAITGERSYCDQFELEDPISHISLSDWADMLVIAPATANIIGKMAHGIGDDLLSTTCLAFHDKLLVVPAMNVNMYNNPIVQDNIAYLTSKGINFLEPAKGMLACGYEGKGKYPPNEDVIDTMKVLLCNSALLTNSRVLITAGASIETIDPMRYITNHSSGKMGIALTKVSYLSGNRTSLVHSNLSETIPYYLDKVFKTLSAQEMFTQVKSSFEDYEVIIMSAAVADYTPKIKSTEKIKKSGKMNIELERTRDILKYLGENKRDNQILVGFAAESENIIENGRGKLDKKNLDLLIANNINVSGQNITSAFLITKGEVEEFAGTKLELSLRIFEKIAEIKDGK